MAVSDGPRVVEKKTAHPAEEISNIKPMISVVKFVDIGEAVSFAKNGLIDFLDNYVVNSGSIECQPGEQ
jgi:hypothetical protein